MEKETRKLTEEEQREEARREREDWLSGQWDEMSDDERAGICGR